MLSWQKQAKAAKAAMTMHTCFLPKSTRKIQAHVSENVRLPSSCIRTIVVISDVKTYFCKWNSHLSKVQLIFIDILNLLLFLILFILICFHVLLCSLVSLLDGLLLQPAPK